MIQQMENSIKMGRNLIDEELDLGLLSLIIKPIIKIFYDHWSQNDAREGTLIQINISLESGKKLLHDGDSAEFFDKLVQENFPKFLEADQTCRQCNKHHKNYEELKQIAKETFINYLEEVVKLLGVKEDVDNYGDLSRIAFKSKEEAFQNLMNQLNFTDRGIKIVEKDISILRRPPIGKKIIVKALRKGFEQTKTEFINALNETYNQK